MVAGKQHVFDQVLSFFFCYFILSFDEEWGYSHCNCVLQADVSIYSRRCYSYHCCFSCCCKQRTGVKCNQPDEDTFITLEACQKLCEVIVLADVGA